MKAKVAVLISGAGTNMAALLYAAKAETCPYELVLVASNDPDAAGLKIADAEGIATWSLSHKGMNRGAFDALVNEQLRAAGAEYVALAGYMRILSDDFVAQWAGRMINIHPSLLPLYKGLNTHSQAIEAGDKFAESRAESPSQARSSARSMALSPYLAMSSSSASNRLPPCAAMPAGRPTARALGPLLSLSKATVRRSS